MVINVGFFTVLYSYDGLFEMMWCKEKAKENMQGKDIRKHMKNVFVLVMLCYYC